MKFSTGYDHLTQPLCISYHLEIIFILSKYSHLVTLKSGFNGMYLSLFFSSSPLEGFIQTPGMSFWQVLNTIISKWNTNRNKTLSSTVENGYSRILCLVIRYVPTGRIFFTINFSLWSMMDAITGLLLKMDLWPFVSLWSERHHRLFPEWKLSARGEI